MDIASQAMRILESLPEKDRSFLLKLAKNDSKGFFDFVKQVFQIRTAIRTGDRKLWQKLQNRQAGSLNRLNKELMDNASMIVAKKGFGTYKN